MRCNQLNTPLTVTESIFVSCSLLLSSEKISFVNTYLYRKFPCKHKVGLVLTEFLCELLFFIKQILGNRYVPGVSSCQQTSDNNLGVAGSTPSTLTTSLAIPIPSSSSSNGPSN